MSSHSPSRRSILRGAAVAGAAAALSPLVNFSTAAAATSGSYVIRFDKARQQTILGLGFEIQSDSIGSGNNGLPDEVSGVPLDLTDSERTRFIDQMLKGGRSDRGFRYCRLAMGLYYRGLDPTRKLMRGRYPGQTAQLADMIQRAGIEGTSVEYWSPAPGWKSNDSYIGGKLKSFEPAFLDEFGAALVADLDYLTDGGVPVSMWGLQNEPRFSTPYSSCVYSAPEYLAAFKAAASRIRAKYPDVMITAESQDGWHGAIGKAIKSDPTALSYVDAWTYHHIGWDSKSHQTPDQYTSGAAGKLVFNNEFEYLDNKTSDWRTINTAQSIMNWMVFQDAPTWFWLHALKPIANAEAAGYSLGYWRPPSDKDFSRFPDLKAGHWTWNPQNWNALAGFVKYMPWDSVRYMVDESARLEDQRIMAWKTPGGKPVFAITNRSATESFTYTVDTQTSAPFEGHRYGPSTNDKRVGFKTGPELTITVPPLSVEFWVRTP
ncbi:twin-arginine translocation signal domain-containing protein [Streptomyces sp. JL1001]|uniref:Twin-arginine translocation signal domain-containing protein n=1 Tax=Streptomyces sp. JL1001 TaxID=3078227 RepID=A0AAU8KCT9_9ACTN|nr:MULTISPECIES: twin-arginine translocation signal domain-containing protein [unclassified Streptomyces]PJN27366.1 hypothetical protein CG717_27400 [Streptomyces sp. CB02613]SCE00197.1 O-Glycosyl hydrolase [Streptomyces sp. Termitarium-T10T-6]